MCRRIIHIHQSALLFPLLPSHTLRTITFFNLTTLSHIDSNPTPWKQNKNVEEPCRLDCPTTLPLLPPLTRHLLHRRFCCTDSNPYALSRFLHSQRRLIRYLKEESYSGLNQVSALRWIPWAKFRTCLSHSGVDADKFALATACPDQIWWGTVWRLGIPSTSLLKTRRKPLKPVSLFGSGSLRLTSATVRSTKVSGIFLDKMETYHGYVRTPADAIKLFEACRLGLLPRVQRRLSEKERQSIRSGSVFVWDEREAGMRRWTDGKSWSASRVSGSFLTYREMEGKRGGGFGGGGGRRGAGKTPDSGRGSDEDQDDGEPEGYRYKADGLMKQSFSITTSTGQHLHLISYYARPQAGQDELPQPTSDVSLRGIVPAKGMYPESSMGETNQTPALTRAPMQQGPYMIAPQHPQHAQHPPPPHQAGYPPHYGQPGYGWPPSPVATPPYGHYAAPYPPAHHQMIPHPSQPPLPHPQYAPAPHEARTTLPPPMASKPGSFPSPHYSHSPLPPRLHEVPREHHLQALAQPALADPRVSATSVRTTQGPLPALGAVTAGPPGSSLAAMSTPPSRALSVSPPRSSHSETAGPVNGNKASLSALLHPTTNGETKTASIGSANSSPRTNGIGAPEKGGVSEDARALRMLDRKFCI